MEQLESCCCFSNRIRACINSCCWNNKHYLYGIWSLQYFQRLTNADSKCICNRRFSKRHNTALSECDSSIQQQRNKRRLMEQFKCFSCFGGCIRSGNSDCCRNNEYHLYSNRCLQHIQRFANADSKCTCQCRYSERCNTTLSECNCSIQQQR